MYSTEVNGEVLRFGTSGLLYRSNKLMYDRNTNTLWTQFLGEPVVGPLADSGIVLERLPVVLTTWGEWRTAHPDTTVPIVDPGFYCLESYLREEDPCSAYADYRASPNTMFAVWKRSDLLGTKAEVLGLTVDDEHRAYPLELLRGQPVVNDSLGGQDFVVVTDSEAGASRVYERGANRFSMAEPVEGEAVILVDGEGRRWRMEEEALVLVDDPTQRLPRVPTHVAYWFGWYAFHPDTDVWGASGRIP